MTVKCLTNEQKTIIAYQFEFLKLTIKELCDEYKRSPRTINRVLDEMDVAPVRHKRVRKEKPVAVEIELPKLTAFENFKCFLKAVFNKKSIKNNVSANQ